MTRIVFIYSYLVGFISKRAMHCTLIFICTVS